MIALLLRPWVIFTELIGVWTAPDNQLTTRQNSELDREARAMAWRVRRVFDALAVPGTQEKLARDFAEILPGAGVLIGWFDIVARAVAAAEQRYGTGNGKKKARAVRGVILRFLHKVDIELPNVPDFLEPLVFDAAIQASIEAMVALYDVNRLWPDTVPDTGVTEGTAAWWRRFVSRVNKALEKLAWRIVLRAEAVDPEFEAEVAAATDTVAVEKVRSTVMAFLHLTAGLATDRAFVKAVMEVISVAVREAEAAGHWDGPTKRAFATALVLAMMEEFGWIPEGAWYRGALEGAIGLALDLVVRRLNTERPSWREAPVLLQGASA